MKKNRIRKIIVFFVTFTIILVCISGIENNKAYAKGIIKIKLSDYLDKEGGRLVIDNNLDPDFLGSCEVIVDVDASFECIYVDGDVTFEGNKKLDLEWLYSKGKMTFKSGTNVNVVGESNDSLVYSGGDFKLAEGASLNVDFKYDYDFDTGVYGMAIETPADMELSGNLNVNSNFTGVGKTTNSEGEIVVYGNVKMTCMGDAIYGNCADVRIMGANVNIQSNKGSYLIHARNLETSNSTINIKGGVAPIFCWGDIYIAGGTIKISGINCNFYSSNGEIFINDGYIESTCTYDSDVEFYNIHFYTAKGIKIGDKLGIISPEGGIIKTGKSSYGESYYYIANADGSNPKTIIIDKKSKIEPKPAPQPNKDDKKTPTYSNEWVNGKWYDANGNQTYAGTLSWKSNATGWWVEDSAGWYPQDSWQKIDGVWYYFKPDGYMAMNEYFKGYWFNSDGSWDSQYLLSWKCNATGWWVEDISGWWPSSSWLKIDGYWYYFDASGYMVTSQYVDGWWISADGVCY